MPAAYVILAEEDRPSVERLVLPVLPSNGCDCWVSRHHLSDAAAMEQVIAQCRVVIVVLSPASISPAAAAEVEAARGSGRTLIGVQLAEVGKSDRDVLPDAAWAAPRVDFTMEREGEAPRLLASLLPPADPASEETPAGAEPIPWDARLFSASLVEATQRHDHARAEALVQTVVRQLARRGGPYPDEAAAADLQKLQGDREFELMRLYGDALLATGTQKDSVRRRYAQALIETRDYDRALAVLRSIIDDAATSPAERAEAYGLIGRTFKQRYVQEQNPDWIREAIIAYGTMYDEDPSRVWHGVNTASCIVRAQRDGIEAAPPGRAQEIARQVLETLAAKDMKVWDYASRVEALVVLERYDEAERALEEYINHPAMQAFEVSSTLRQFDEVLQLGQDPRGADILERLREAVERYRGSRPGPAPEPPAGFGLADESMDAPATRPLVLRVTDPGWEPAGVPDLEIQTRLGTIFTARGSDASVRELLNDPVVVSVEESRPAGTPECDRSLPLIHIAAEYADAAGKYQETGDRALIAVVDDGIDVLHEAFLDGNETSRIIGIWDQTDSTGPAPPPFTYGTFHDEAAIAKYVETGKVPASLGRNADGHGTHVASIAAGRAAGPFAGGVAPEAKLLVVISAENGAIGYSASHIEALAFIDAFAAARKMPVVVNVSQGMNAGAHDGKSSLEVAFDAFSGSGTKPGRVIVKSAGNEREKNGHAFVTLLPQSTEELRWERFKGAAATERVELWFNSAAEVEFRLRDPDDAWSPVVGTASPKVEGKFDEGGSYQLVFTKRHVDNGDSLLAIELGNMFEEAAQGEWLLEITSRNSLEDVHIHAWLERRRGVPTAFLDHISKDMTLSVPGTAASVITVGAIDACNPFRMGRFSSYGPTRDRQEKPLVCAPGVKVKAARGGTNSDVLTKSGTSQAAPHVAGAIALLLSRKAKSGRLPGSNQIASAMRQKTQNYNGRWDRGQGYGVIDVAALLAAF